MNRWQKVFAVFGVVAITVLFVFPPQIVNKNNIKFLPFWEGNPIDWLRLFLWFVAIVFVTGLGMAINKVEHK